MSANLSKSTRSRRSGMTAFTGLLVALVAFGGACKTGPKGPLSVPLTFTPNNAEPLSASLASGDVKVYVRPVEDKRENAEQIGENREGAAPVPVYASGKTPAEFVHEVMETELRSLGADLADAPDAADRVIVLELRKFFVEESPRYRGEVIAGAEVTDNRGKRLWGKEVVAGQGGNFGRSLSIENYNQTYSDATREMIRRLVGNPSFVKALAK